LKREDLRNFPKIPKESEINLMTRKFPRFPMLAAFVLPIVALAQASSPAGSSPVGLPAAPSAAASGAAGSSATAPAVSNPAGYKIGTINIEQAILASNEGQRDFEALSKKLEPKQNELKEKNDELESLKKQLNTQGEKLNDETRGTLVKQIEQRQKSFDRQRQDAQEDFQAQQGEILNRIIQKMAPVIVKYATDNGFAMILDTSNPWPQGPVLWAGPSVDITKSVVEAYNAQSNVPAPARPATGAGTRPSLPGTKPATPSTTPPKPQGPGTPK
jgi:outer membrane protein